MSIANIKRLFLIASLYDVILGLIFGLFFGAIYTAFGITAPNHAAYIQLPAFFIVIFGVGFYLVYRDPLRHRGIMLLGILMKANFSLIVFGHMLFGSIPNLYLPWAIFDGLFCILFLIAYRSRSAETPCSR